MAKVLKAASVLKPNGEKEIIYDSSSLLAERVTAVENRAHIVGTLSTTITDYTGRVHSVNCRWYDNGWMEQWGSATKGLTYVLPFSYTPAVVLTPVDSSASVHVANISTNTTTNLQVTARYILINGNITNEPVAASGFCYYVYGWKA